MSEYGMYVKFVTHDGKREDLTKNLLEVANMMQSVDGSEIYIINESLEEPNVIWVTEIWSSKEAHQASLNLQEGRKYIEMSLPLIKKVEKIEIQPLGGHGIS